MKRLLLFALLVLPLGAVAGDRDDFGSWLEIGGEKRLPRNFSLGIEGELRMDDNSTKVDRLGLGLGLGYKVNKYLRLSATYSVMGSYTPEKRKEHYKDDIEDSAHWNGYNLTSKFWTPKHRLSIEATGSVKLWRWLRIAVRERYQYTHTHSREGIDVEKWRYKRGTVDGEDWCELKEDYPEHTTKDRPYKNEQYLRSRLKLSLDKKHLAWGPFVSVEFHNSIDENFHLHKIRSRFGTEYKFNRSHSLSLAYVLTQERDEHPHERMHAVSVGYEFKF